MVTTKRNRAEATMKVLLTQSLPMNTAFYWEDGYHRSNAYSIIKTNHQKTQLLDFLCVYKISSAGPRKKAFSRRGKQQGQFFSNS
jgi:hypothetical protein